MLTILAAFLLVGAKPNAPSRRPPTDAELEAISTRGAALAGYDRAAWNATDAVRALHPDERLFSMYIARRDLEGTWVVVFGKKTPADDAFVIAYEAVQTDSPTHFEARALVPAISDTDWYLRAARALATARLTFKKPDPRPYNVAILASSDGHWLVYLYPAVLTPDVWPIGGDVRYEMSLDGRIILSERTLHTSVLESHPPRDVKVTMSWHTHVLSSVPEDTDVMAVLSRTGRYPEYITSNPFAYVIDADGRIFRLGLTKDFLATKKRKE